MDYLGLPPVDLPILAEPDAVVASLLTKIEVDLLPSSLENINVETIPKDKPNTVPPEKDAGPITFHDVARCLKESAGDRKITFVRLPLGWPGDSLEFRGPLDFLGYAGGGGLGAGPGMAIGSALALRNSGRLPIAITGDGDYSMGVNALWTAAHYRIPLLVIVTNNRGYYTSGVFQGKMAEIRHRPEENMWIGTGINDPPLDIAALARAQGLKGEGPVSDVKDLTDLLTRALEEVENGQTWVVDVLIDQSDFTSPVARID
jgi:thiamine pyrophosphate-dependent acetolactate synthase large subunit-like protein